jgi:hypothetical protein
VVEDRPDVILLTETWCNTEINNAELQVDGYQLEVDCRRDRCDTNNGIGGGLLVYTKLGIETRPVQRFNGTNFNQYCSFKLMTSKPINIVLVYRPPNSGQNNTEELCNLLSKVDGDTIIIGDFNYPEVDWIRMATTNRSQSFLDRVLAMQLDRLVHFPTHNRGNILDLVLSNCSDRILNVINAGRLGRSDHSIIKITVDAKFKSKKSNQYRYLWNKANFNGMKLELSNRAWQYNINMDVESDWNEIKVTLMELTENYVPKVLPRTNDRPKWLTSEIVRMVRQKKRAWKNAKNFNAGVEVDAYKKLEKEVAKKIRNAKRKYERELAAGDDKKGRKFSNYVKSKTKSRTGIGPLKMENGSITSDSKEMAELLNKYFTSVFEKERLDNLPAKQSETESRLNTIDITRELVLEKLKGLKINAAPGPDGISPRLLKELRYLLADPLRNLFEKSLESCTVPKDWKLATVTPIYKKGPKSEPSNYRPVSLTSIPCKVMESIIKDKLMAHLQSENLIKQSQHGFMEGRSCATNLLMFHDELTKAIDAGIPADIFFLDFAKAFDKVPKERLIIKLEAKGVQGKVKEWIHEWLTGRTQRVVIGDQSSEESEVDSSVPQVTILGPPLFTIHIDDIDDFVKLIDLLKNSPTTPKG